MMNASVFLVPAVHEVAAAAELAVAAGAAEKSDTHAPTDRTALDTRTKRIDPADKLSAVALGLIISGAFGNLFDRLVRHEVIDWAQFNLGLFIFPDFNVADSAIVIGVALLLLDVVTQET